MNRTAGLGVLPRFLGGEHEHWGKQLAKRHENLLHRSLGGATTRRNRSIAIHPVLGDVDVKTTQVDRAKLVDRMINFVKLECFVSGATIANHLIEPLQNPTIS